jgi:hypothetical protein
MVKVVKFRPLMSSLREICKMGIFWVDDFKGGHLNMSIMKATQLNRSMYYVGLVEPQN